MSVFLPRRLHLFYTSPIPFPSSLPLPPFRERMKLPFMTDQCEQMLKICNEFVRLQVSYDEYLCMKVLLLLSTGNGWNTLPFEKSQWCLSNFRNCNYSGIKTDLKITFPMCYTVTLPFHCNVTQFVTVEVV